MSWPLALLLAKVAAAKAPAWVRKSRRFIAPVLRRVAGSGNHVRESTQPMLLNAVRINCDTVLPLLGYFSFSPGSFLMLPNLPAVSRRDFLRAAGASVV